jgi:hypothetical protein
MDPQHLYKECSYTKTEYKRKEAVKRAGQRLVVLEKSPNDQYATLYVYQLIESKSSSILCHWTVRKI